MGQYLNLVSYFGGKYPHLKWLINLFPKGNYHFVDMMCGSANVALNVNYPLITVNDLNDEIINLFYVLREHQDEFLQKLYFTPFARKELENIIDDSRNELIVPDPVRKSQEILCKMSVRFRGEWLSK